MEHVLTADIIFKIVNSLGVALLIYFIKDFKADIKKLTEGLTQVSLSLNTLLTTDKHKEESINELKQSLLKCTKEIQLLKIKVALLERNETKGE